MSGSDDITSLAPDFMKMTQDFLFGDIWKRPGLSQRDKSLITVTVLATLSRVEQIDFHLNKALENGLTREELVAALTHIAFYAGWPSAHSGLLHLKRVLEDRPPADAAKPSEAKAMKVLKSDGMPSNQGPAEFFTGTVHVTPLVQGEDPSCLSCASVRFDPSARSAWHTHPRGQLLIVTEGAGLVQEWGKPIQNLQKGDVVWTPAGVKHWHGAAATTSLTHTAIQETVGGKAVEWLEQVTDEQYGAAK